MPGRASQEVMPGSASGEVMLLRRKPLRSTVNGSPSSGKSIYYLKDARLGKNSPGRNAGEDHAGTQDG